MNNTDTSAEAVERLTLVLHSVRQTHSSVRVDPKDLDVILSAFATKDERETQVERVTVSEAARVLLNVFEDPDNYAPDDFDWQFLYGEITADHNQNLEICGSPDWPATLAVALRILAEGKDDV